MLRPARPGAPCWRRAATRIEAMIAMAATIAVVYPHMNAIGGDGFWLVREPGRSGRVHAIEACGPAGAAATRQRYRDSGHDVIPPRGPEAMVTVAGRGGRLDEGARARRGDGRADGRGRRPAARHAAGGCDPLGPGRRAGHAVGGAHRPNRKDELWAAPGFAETFLVDGKIPDAGTLRRQPALGATLEHLASRRARRLLPRRRRPRDRRRPRATSARRSPARTWSATVRGWSSR